jgi:hypothetical protein
METPALQTTNARLEEVVVVEGTLEQEPLQLQLQLQEQRLLHSLQCQLPNISILLILGKYLFAN